MVNIFGNHSAIIMRKEFIWTCVQFWMVTERERELFESTKRKALWVVIEKEKLLGGNCILTLIYCLNNKFATQKGQVYYYILLHNTDSCVWWRYLLINPRKEHLVCAIVKIHVSTEREDKDYTEERESTLLRHVGIYLPNHTASRFRKQSFLSVVWNIKSIKNGLFEILSVILYYVMTNRGSMSLRKVGTCLTNYTMLHFRGQ